LFGLPVSTNNLELFYNKELFAAVGLDPEAAPAGWDELPEAATACADPSSGRTGMELFTEPGEADMAVPVVPVASRR
jgi:multiple sugar transport system substrate-binding protein